MGAKTWMLVLAHANARDSLAAKPALDREATLNLASALFPGETLEPIGDGDLSHTCPPRDELHIGCFPGVSIVAAREFKGHYPSKLPHRFIAAGGSGVVTLPAMHSVVDWFAYALWTNGELVRSLSLSPDSGIIEDIGQHLAFEEPYWSGMRPVVGNDQDKDVYPLPFHPLDLGEEALKDRFGYQLEGEVDPFLLDPESIPLVRYRRLRSSWWKFWG